MYCLYTKRFKFHLNIISFYGSEDFITMPLLLMELLTTNWDALRWSTMKIIGNYMLKLGLFTLSRMNLFRISCYLDLTVLGWNICNQYLELQRNGQIELQSRKLMRPTNHGGKGKKQRWLVVIKIGRHFHLPPSCCHVSATECRCLNNSVVSLI